MFGMSGTELIIILVLALLLLGPDKLPEVAKMLGKGMRDFNKATSDIKSTVEAEFNKMAEIADERERKVAQQSPPAASPTAHVLELKPAVGTVAANEPRILPPAAQPPAAIADPDPAAAPVASAEGKQGS